MLPFSNIQYAIITAISFMMFFAACTQKEKTTPNTTQQDRSHAFAIPIEQAHHMDAWKKKGALKTKIKLSFGGRTQLDGTLFTETGGPGIRLEISNDTVAVFDGKNSWVIPSDTAVSSFNLKTWAYFLKAPYKLNDPGTNLKDRQTETIHGKDYKTAKMTFASGTGDTPDDWYILYRNAETNRLHSMAYIVTAGKTVEEANKQPHAITYENINMVEGIPVSTYWKFWFWNEDTGFSDKPIGEATLSNLQFVKRDNLFTKPEGAVKLKGTK